MSCVAALTKLIHAAAGLKGSFVRRPAVLHAVSRTRPAPGSRDADARIEYRENRNLFPALQTTGEEKDRIDMAIGPGQLNLLLEVGGVIGQVRMARDQIRDPYELSGPCALTVVHS
jgi:hypothetical protein